MYLSDLLVKYTHIRSLKSSDLLLLAVPKTKHRCRGDRAFAKLSPSVAIFKSNLQYNFICSALNHH